MLLQVQKVSATEDEMLVGEIGPIVQATRNRLRQEEYSDTIFVPVSNHSLMGAALLANSVSCNRFL